MTAMGSFLVIVKAPEDISPEEKKEFAHWLAKTYDFNRDGEVNYAEFTCGFLSHSGIWVFCLDSIKTYS